MYITSVLMSCGPADGLVPGRLSTIIRLSLMQRLSYVWSCCDYLIYGQDEIMLHMVMLRLSYISGHVCRSLICGLAGFSLGLSAFLLEMKTQGHGLN